MFSSFSCFCSCGSIVGSAGLDDLLGLHSIDRTKTHLHIHIVQEFASLPDANLQWMTKYSRNCSRASFPTTPVTEVLTEHASVGARQNSTVLENCPSEKHRGPTHAVWRECFQLGQLRLDDQLDQPVNFCTLASLLRRCGQSKSIFYGRRLHSYMRMYGYDRVTFLGNCLVQMYGKCGSMEEAQSVFDNITQRNIYSWNILFEAYFYNGNLEAARAVFKRMPQRNLVSWNAMISALAQNKNSKEALQLFSKMRLEGIQPDKITFISILDACTSLSALHQGEEIHATAIDNGYEGDVVVGTALINMYGKCGNLHDAKNMFSRMSQHDVVSWSAMILVCAQNGHDRDALDLFHMMLRDGIKPDKVAFICVLDACASLATLKEGQEVHVATVHSGHNQDLFVGNALVNMYGKCGSLHNSWGVFQGMPQRDVVSWNAMIDACSRNNQSKEALDLFCKMQLDDMEPDIVTFISVLDSCANLAALKEGQDIHVAIIENGYKEGVVVGTALVHMYGKCKDMHNARTIFRRMCERDAISWNAMLTACASSGHEKECLDLFFKMQHEGVKADKVTFMCVLDICINLAALELGQGIHSLIIDGEQEQDRFVLAALINLYGKCGRLSDARCLFGNMTQYDVVAWSAMITACVENGHADEALDLFQEMQLEGFVPDKITFTSALDACASLAALDDGQKIHSAIVDNGYERDCIVETALVDMYGKCGSLRDSKSVFCRMPHRDTVAWNAMIAAYAQNGYGEEALDFFGEMQREGIKPDGITFISTLTACNHTGRVDDGWRYFISMEREHGISQTLAHYLCFVDLLCRAGHLQEAEYLIDTMPFEKVPAAWSYLLGACAIHRDVERGLRAANHYVQLNPLKAAPYIMLANIYAAAGGWDD